MGMVFFQGSAPGPSDELLQQEGAAKKEVDAAKGTTRERLQQALRKLSILQGQVDAAKGDQQDYPLSFECIFQGFHRFFIVFS